MSRRQSLRRNSPTSFPIQDNEGVAKQEIKFPHEIANPIRMNACVVKHSILISTAYLWKALSRHACFEFELLSLQNFAKLNLSQTCFPVHGFVLYRAEGKVCLRSMHSKRPRWKLTRLLTSCRLALVRPNLTLVS